VLENKKIVFKGQSIFMRTGWKKTSEQESNNYWEKISRSFKMDSVYNDPFLRRLQRQEYLKLIDRWGGVPEKGWVLKTDLFDETVSDDGRYIDDLMTSKNHVVGIDISKGFTQHAKHVARSSRTHYMTADVRSLPFANGSFQFIVSPSTLDHFADISDLKQSLNELARLVKPGGNLIITLDNRQNIFDPLLRMANRFHFLPFFLGHSFNIRQLHIELQSTGLQVIECTAILHNPRLVAVALLLMARIIGIKRFTGMVHRLLLSAQQLGQTRLRYYTGSFIAVRAVKPGLQNL
jgi:SAM-dependent methyltransferase